MTVNEIRNLLVNEYGYDTNEVNDIKGKTKLVELLKINLAQKEINDIETELGISLDNGIEENIEVIENEYNTDNEQDSEEQENIPTPNDLEWSDYVLSFLDKSEKYKDRPTVDGLRRIGTYFLGDYVTFDTQIVQTPDEHNGDRATAVCTIQTAGSSFFAPKTIAGSADCYSGNTMKPYYKHPVSMAETRAEGRALRRALQLKTIVAEETFDEMEEYPNTDDKLINDEQLNFLSMMGKKLDINILKFLKLHIQDFTIVQKIEYNTASGLFQVLNEYQRQVQPIPEEIKIYDPNWQSNK